MSYNNIERIRNIWRWHITRRWLMCKYPNSYAEKVCTYEYQREIYKRALLPFQDIYSLSKPISGKLFSTTSIEPSEALFYGALQSLLDFAGISVITMPPYKLGIQHGYVFEICNWEKSKIDFCNFVWSKKLVEMYHEYTSNPRIYAIGAPFFYSKSLLDCNQLRKEKERLGRNLLAFPMHSQSHVDTNYDPTLFLNTLKEERKRFDTVRVCMYWKDIQRGVHKVFLDAGFECVCNGHLYDLNFLRRQKTLFELADATISNGVGSHIGYSIYMGKPHWLIDDEYEYVNTQKGGDAADLTEVSRMANFQRVKAAFLNNSEYIITQNQKDVIDEFWGMSDMRTPEEIRKLLMQLYEL